MADPVALHLPSGAPTAGGPCAVNRSETVHYQLRGPRGDFNAACKRKRAVIKGNDPHAISRYRLHARATCQWALSLVFPSVSGSLERIPSLWEVVASLNIPSRRGSVVRGQRNTHWDTKVPSLLPSRHSFLSQVLSFVRLSSADSLRPSPHLPRAIASSSLSPSFSPVGFTVCRPLAPIRLGLFPSLLPLIHLIIAIYSSPSHSSSLLPPTSP